MYFLFVKGFRHEMAKDSFLRVEMHCHSASSPDSLASVETMIARARHIGLDKMIITDHNTLRGARKARYLAPDLVIAGEEVLTTRGELLAAFVQEEIPAGLPPLDALRALREQGAFVSVAHPFDLQRHGWQMEDLEAILPLVDAVEVFNSRCIRQEMNHQARDLALRRGIPGTVGSDAHSLREIGRATLLLPAFSDATELRRALPQARQLVRRSSPMVHLISTFAKGVRRLSPARD